MFVPRNQIRRIGSVAMIALGGFLSFSAVAADQSSATYSSDVAFCKSGQSQQDYATCMREAGAAKQQRGQLQARDDNAGQLAMNAERRCDVQQGEDKAACMARVEAPTSVQGSVAGGGLLRESVVIESK